MPRKATRQTSSKTESAPTTQDGHTEKPRKGRKPVDPNETRDQKLARLANARVTKALKYIGYVGNLAAYKPTEKQIEAIVTALATSCQNVQNKLTGTRKESFMFTLQ